PGRDRAHLRLCLREGNAGFKAANDVEKAILDVGTLIGSDHERTPRFNIAPKHRAIEGRWHDADDDDGFAVEPQRAADDVGVSGKMTRPKAVAENSHGNAAGLSFFNIEDASEGGLDAEHWEKVGGRMNGCEAF